MLQFTNSIHLGRMQFGWLTCSGTVVEAREVAEDEASPSEPSLSPPIEMREWMGLEVCQCEIYYN